MIALSIALENPRKGGKNLWYENEELIDNSKGT